MNRANLIDYLVKRISSLERPHPIRVAIDGIDAAGKSTLAGEMGESLSMINRPVIRSTVDGFHNPRSIRYRRGSLSSQGYFHDSFDYESVASKLLEPLSINGNRHYQTAVFDYRTDRPVDSAVSVAPDDAILLFDGIFLQRPDLARFWDFKIFVEVTFETALERAISRYLSKNGQEPPPNGISELRRQYRLRYFPAQEEYLDCCHPNETADVAIDNNDFSNPFIRRQM